MSKVHFFKDQKECEEFFKLVAKNNNEPFSDDFIFEGNSGMKYEWIREIGETLGYNRIGVVSEIRKDADFIDEIFIEITNIDWVCKGIKSRIWIDADEVSIEPGGYLRLWWD